MSGLHEGERPYLLGVAYRLLGSASDAEDIVQEALTRRLPDEGVRSARAYLTTVVTRLCLDELRSARRRRVRYLGPWLPEPVLSAAFDAPPRDELEHRETLSLALLTLLEALTPLARAVFVLREVLDLEFSEIARALGKREEACRKILSRARSTLAARPARPARPVAAAPAQAQVAAELFGALMAGDVDALARLLTEDAVALTDHGGKASAARRPLLGATRVARFLVGLARKARGGAVDVTPALVCGAPALVARRAGGVVESALVLRVVRGHDGPRVAAVDIIRNPDKLQALARGVCVR